MSSSKKPWPTKAAMTQIYEQHLWGGADHDFYSGQGSHDPEIVNPYLNAVIQFLENKNNTLSIVDLGCGDFNIGKALLPYCKEYIGIDIVEKLINRNKRLFQIPKVQFRSLDITTDKLPKGDCAMLRQVLQHLSNTEISRVVNQLDGFKYLLLTEHIPNGDYVPNIDIISGQGIRLKHNSGVAITRPPFNLKFKTEVMLNKIVLNDNKGTIITYLYELC